MTIRCPAGSDVPPAVRTFDWRFPCHFIMRFLRALDLALCKAEQRRQLLELDDDQLADIGLTRRAAREEAKKYLWQ